MTSVVPVADGAGAGSYFRISDMGGTGSVAYRGSFPTVAYNPNENEYLVAWQGEDDAGGLVDGENEIFGQRLDATTGAEIGDNDFPISDMGGIGDPSYDGYEPGVAFSDTGNEYLVVWRGDDNVYWLANDEMEIFGQRISLHTAWLPLVLRKS